MRIGIYGTARNEEANVDDWLASTEGADVVVLNDTGSSDHTVKMFRRRALRDERLLVHELPVEPMLLSNALNVAMGALPDDIDLAIRLDLDERLQPGWRDLIEKAWAERATDKPAMLPIWFDHGGCIYKHSRVHTPEFEWMLPVHEVLSLNGAPVAMDATADAYELLPTEATIKHFQLPRDRSGVLRELIDAHEADPTNVRMVHYLARQYTYEARWQDAIPLLRAHTESWDSPEERSESWRLLGDCYRALMPVEDVPLRPYRNAAHVCPHRREGWVWLAELCYDQGLWSECLGAAERALAITERSWHFNYPISWGPRPADLAALASWYLGRPDDAIRYGTLACELAPDDARLQDNLGFYTGALISA